MRTLKCACLHIGDQSDPLSKEAEMSIFSIIGEDLGYPKPPENEEDPILLRRALDALTAHRSYNSLTRNGKKIPIDHPIWKCLSRAEATWHDLMKRFGEKP
jgi:hypothetical protein